MDDFIFKRVQKQLNNNEMNSCLNINLQTIMKKTFFVFILIGFLLSNVLGNTVTYNGTNTIVPNPEKGLYQYTAVYTSNYTPLTVAEVQSARTNKDITLIFRYFILDNFKTGPIDNATLNKIEQDLLAMRNGGAKGIIRFSYINTWNGSSQGPFGDASKAVVLQHIDQLTPILQNYSDVIATLQAGFIGIWGEWFYSDYFQPASTTQGRIDRKEVLDKLLDVMPTNRMVSHRYPEGKAQMYGVSVPGGAIGLSDAYSGSALSRIAFHNDCFLVSANDYTYDNNTNGRAYAAQESDFYVMGGESCGTSSFSNCTNAISDLETYNWSYLNDYYHPAVMSQWQNEGCYDEVVRRLGYRFRLINSTVSPSVETSQNVDITIEMANDGFARPYNPRNVEVVFRSQADQSEYTFSIVPQGQDARLLLPAHGLTKTLTASIPASGLPVGDYDLFLNLSDPESTLSNNPNYSIRTANTGLWEGTTGYNALQNPVTITQGGNPQNPTVTYNGSNAIVQNPEKGLYRYTDTYASNYNPLTLAEVQSIRNEDITLVFRYFILDNFKTGPIDNATLTKIEQDFTNMRNGGVKGIIRFSYINTWNGSSQGPFGDASKAIVLQHIDQLTPILQANSDVIATLQAGFIGIWGEWFYSDYFQPASTTQGRIDRKEVLDKLLDIMPTNRMVSHRYPEGKAQMYQLTIPDDSITINDAYSGSNLSRIAFHSDCFLVSANDYTFSDNVKGRQYAAGESQYYVMGGESCGTSSFSNCTNALSDLEDYHWSYINDGYHPAVLAQWQTEGCFDEVVRRLGYRFRLINSTITQTVSGNQNIDVSIEMANDGFSRPYNPRNVNLVFRSQADQSEYSFSIVPQGQDARLWLPAHGVTKTLSAAIPASGLPNGDYDVFLNLNDPETSLSNNPNFSIRTANTGLWEASTGYNDLQTVVTVSGGDNLAVSAWLEGALYVSNNQYATTMRTDLFDAGLLPGQTPAGGTATPAGQPYSIAPWNYNGTEGANWTDTDYQAVVSQTGQKPVDWVLISFRTSITKASQVAKTAALLMEDGTVYFPSPVTLNPQTPVYALIEHRNHLGALSATANSPVNNLLTFDFRTENGYMNGGFSQKEVSTGRYALYGGDGDQLTDSPGYEITGKDRILWSQNNGLFSLYDASDFTMDKDISGFDRVFWSANNGIFSNVER